MHIQYQPVSMPVSRTVFLNYLNQKNPENNGNVDGFPVAALTSVPIQSQITVQLNKPPRAISPLWD